MSAYQNTWYEFDGPVKCEVEDGYILRVYGREFTSAFLRGTYTEVELWARPLKTSILIQHLDWAEFQFGPSMEYVEFYLDRLPRALDRNARCWATVWGYRQA
jgi:hypothetical protein